MATITLVGYLAFPNQEALLKHVRSSGGCLVDIRFSPASRNPAWSGARLRAALGSNYVHLKAFGNENYKAPEKGVKLVDAAKGLEATHGLAKSFPHIFIMCACKDPQRCHRKDVGALLAGAGYSVSEFDHGANQNGLGF